MTERPVWWSPGEAQASAAGRALNGRVLLFAKPRFARNMPHFLHSSRSGLGLCGPDAGQAAAKIRHDGYNGVLLADPAFYDKKAATEEEPFELPRDQLFGADLNTVLQDQIDRGATLAVAPSRFVHAGDVTAFKSLVLAAQRIDRDDVVVPIPVDVAWLRDEFLGKLTAGMRRIPHLKGIVLGAQGNPTEKFAKATANLRTVMAEVPGLGLWRGDQPTAFDSIAYGASFAVIGAGGSLRHVVPPDEEAQSRRPYNHTPSVFIPEMLRYSMGEYIAQRYANQRAPRCFCSVCQGRSLDYFNSRQKEVRESAQAHNAQLWAEMLDDLFDHPAAIDRQRWWKACCEAAVQAQLRESQRIEQPGAFKPSTPLTKMAELPLHTEVASPARNRQETAR
ncbi:hypothetical protein ACPSM1_03670 [Micromonospora chersina]|uniref:hypothetical protein n=1 Tax=Micromonospora chersina TaxID=47854 RepID=UPI003CB55472